MNKTFYAIIAILLLCLTSGCIQSKEEFTINPDGSGKVTIEVTMPVDAISIGKDENKDPQKSAIEQTEKILKSSNKIDAWKDVSYKITDDGKYFFKGTAYFRNIADYKNKDEMIPYKDVKLKNTPDGKMQFTMLYEEKKKSSDISKKMTDKEIDDYIKAEKVKYQKSRGMIAAIFGEMRVEKIYNMPGKIEKSACFDKDKNNSNRISIVFEGQKIIKIMDDMMADEKWMKEKILAGSSPQKDGPSAEEFNEKLFGTKELPYALLKPADKPQFDYAKEVADANKNYAAMRKQLGLSEAPEALQGEKSEPFKTFYVGRVTLTYGTEDAEKFGYQDGYDLTVIGEMPGAVLNFKEGKLLKAELDNGESILPNDEWRQKISHFNLSEDKSKVLFDLRLKLPGKDAKYIKEISGEATYLVAAGTKKVELGMMDLKTGVKGKELEAEIGDVRESQWQKGSYEFQLKLKADANNIKGFEFLDADGNSLTIEKAGYSGWENNYTFTFRHEGPLPAKAKIIVEMHDKLKEFTIPFKLENITLLGMPAKK